MASAPILKHLPPVNTTFDPPKFSLDNTTENGRRLFAGMLNIFNLKKCRMLVQYMDHTSTGGRFFFRNMLVAFIEAKNSRNLIMKDSELSS
jgi:hypothetical protein